MLSQGVIAFIPRKHTCGVDSVEITPTRFDWFIHILLSTRNVVHHFIYSSEAMDEKNGK